MVDKKRKKRIIPYSKFGYGKNVFLSPKFKKGYKKLSESDCPTVKLCQEILGAVVIGANVTGFSNIKNESGRKDNTDIKVSQEP